MKRIDKFLLWFGRIISLPLAGFCFYIVRTDIINSLKGKGDDIAFAVFLIGGVFCVVYFFALLKVKPEIKNKEDRRMTVNKSDEILKQSMKDLIFLELMQKKYNLSSAEMADKLGISKGCWCRVIKGTENVSDNIRFKAIKAFPELHDEFLGLAEG